MKLPHVGVCCICVWCMGEEPTLPPHATISVRCHMRLHGVIWCSWFFFSFLFGVSRWYWRTVHCSSSHLSQWNLLLHVYCWFHFEGHHLESGWGQWVHLGCAGEWHLRAWWCFHSHISYTCSFPYVNTEWDCNYGIGWDTGWVLCTKCRWHDWKECPPDCRSVRVQDVLYGIM